MKILQVDTVCGIGSTGRIVVDLAEIAAKEGHEVVIAYGRYKAKGWARTYKIGNGFTIRLHGLMTRLFDKHGLLSEHTTKKFIKFIKEFNPDLIHLHNIHGYYLNYKILFKFLKEFNKPVVWTLHDCWAFTGHCAHFDFAGCNKWQTQCEKCPQKNEYPRSFLFDASKRNYELKKECFTSLEKLTLVTPSSWLAEIVKHSFLGIYPISIINNGIDLDVFKPIESDFRKKHLLQDKFIVLGVANVWNKRKGYLDFFKLAEMLDDNYKIVMVGLNDKQIKEVPKKILGIRKTNNVKELAEIYSAADIFFNPTYEDNFPTTNLEALACGTPVVTYDTGGSVESINNECGWVIERGKIETAINILDSFVKDDIIVYNCISRAKKFETHDKYGEYLKLFEQVISEETSLK